MHANFNEPLDLQPIPVEGIFHKVGVDMVCPLQFSVSENCYINTKVHYMTKNVEAAVELDRRTTAEMSYAAKARQLRQYQTKVGSFRVICKHC